MMDRITRTLALSLALLPMAACAENKMQPTTIEAADAWTRATPSGVANGAVYLTLTNNTAQADTLVAASSPVARKVELHESKLNDLGVYTMREVGQVALPQGGSVAFAPGGLHLMLMGLNQPLEVGHEIPVRLEFANSPAINLRVAIHAPGHQTHPAEAPDHSHHHH